MGFYSWRRDYRDERSVLNSSFSHNSSVSSPYVTLHPKFKCRPSPTIGYLPSSTPTIIVVRYLHARIRAWSCQGHSVSTQVLKSIGTFIPRGSFTRISQTPRQDRTRNGLRSCSDSCTRRGILRNKLVRPVPSSK